MREFFADLHIHVGKSESGKWIKIPTSSHLTVRNIISHAREKKGMDLVGIVDALSPLVLEDIESLIREKELILLDGGGYRHCNGLNIILGAEIETVENSGSNAHVLIFLPTIEKMKSFSNLMRKYIRNINLSSQNAKMSLCNLIYIAKEYQALVVPAHIFTPYKSIYGACSQRISNLLDGESYQYLHTVELGLSADTEMADCIGELQDFSFLTNSDAHSIDKIAREYNILFLETGSFEELLLALRVKKGRHIIANYGMDPLLGKYHSTACGECGQSSLIENILQPCIRCGSLKWVRGVRERIMGIADTLYPVHPKKRPPYYYQVPLEFIPGVGKKKLQRLLEKFQTEMNILHNVSCEDLTEVVGAKTAQIIYLARKGRLPILSGAGGVYGRLVEE